MEHDLAAVQAESLTGAEPAKTHLPSKAAFVLGIVACACNILLVLAIPGFILGLIAIIMGAIHYRRHRLAKAGLVLGVLSFIPLATYLFSMLALMRADPFLFG